jgi:hypothetical protein
MTPPEVQEKREQQYALHIAEMEKEAMEIKDCSIEQRRYGISSKKTKRSNSGTRKRKE